MFLAAFVGVLVPPAVASFLGKTLLGAVLTVSILRAALAAAYQLGAPRHLQLGAGAAALLLFALSVYAGSAFLFEDLRRRTVLPIRLRGVAREASGTDAPSLSRAAYTVRSHPVHRGSLSDGEGSRRPSRLYARGRPKNPARRLLCTAK